MKLQVTSMSLWLLTVLAASLLASPAVAQSLVFTTGDPDGRMATASRPGSQDRLEIESADDFILNQETSIRQATLTGLLPAGTEIGAVAEVVVEIYHVFPLDSSDPPDGRVPSRVNSPSDVALDSRDSGATDGNFLNFDMDILAETFTAANSVLNGIHPRPDQTTNGEGPVTGEEVRFHLTFPKPFDLPAGHYFFVPQVKLNTGDFFWLSAPRPIVQGTPFMPDLQSWIRNADLEPDWLRVGTDIVGGAVPPTFNASFSLHGSIAHPHAESQGIAELRSTPNGVSFSAPGEGMVRITLHDVQGRLVKELFEGSARAGSYQIPIGGGIPTGIYFARMKVNGSQVGAAKVVLAR